MTPAPGDNLTADRIDAATGKPIPPTPPPTDAELQAILDAADQNKQEGTK